MSTRGQRIAEAIGENARGLGALLMGLADRRRAEREREEEKAFRERQFEAQQAHQNALLNLAINKANAEQEMSGFSPGGLRPVSEPLPPPRPSSFRAPETPRIGMAAGTRDISLGNRLMQAVAPEPLPRPSTRFEMVGPSYDPSRDVSVQRARALQEAAPPRFDVITMRDSAGNSLYRVNPQTGERERLGSAPTPEMAPQWREVTTADGVFRVEMNTGRMERLGDSPRSAPSLTASQKTAITENKRSINLIDRALAELERRPQGVGAPFLIMPDAVAQRFDPEGVDLRAMIADMGSLKIHERAGANVTAREWPRLRPFIPSAGDTRETVRKKLIQMKRAIEAENAAIQSFAPDATVPNTAESIIEQLRAEGRIQ